jgi:hypothetical protein
MTALAPLEHLLGFGQGIDLALLGTLGNLYGGLRFPTHPGRPHVLVNFVATLDGGVSPGVPGKAGGGENSGFNPRDRTGMGLLRATADAVVIGTGTLHAASPDHRWTAELTCPPLAAAHRTLRATLGKPDQQLNVVVSTSGDHDLDRRLFCSAEEPVLIVTTPQVASRDGSLDRHGFVAGNRFAPEYPRWGAVVGLKRGGSRLFLCYGFVAAA